KNWTSLAHIDIIMSLEEEFEIKFNKEDLSLLKSQNALLEKIHAYYAEAQGLLDILKNKNKPFLDV
ncbi:acyl carrier protein, partial [Campylobacter coli]